MDDEAKPSSLKSFFIGLRRKRIIETLAAFIGGGWLLLEFVHWILVDHYHFPEKTIDITFVTILGALLSTLVWRWFGSTDKRPGNIKVEVLLVPLIILAALSIDLIILLEVFGISGKTLLIAAVALGLGISWIILKSLRWAAAVKVPSAGHVQKYAEPSSPASCPPEKSIVVLPFVNISPEEGQEYFCDGMTEEIITDLSHIHDLLVISRSSAMTFKGTKKTIPEIAQAVGVRYVLEGSVRKAGNGLRITAQLIDSATDAHLWAEKYTGTLDDIFDIQEKVSRSIVDSLKLTLTPEEMRRLSGKPMGNFAVYECYLRAYQGIYQFTEDGRRRALDHLHAGLAISGDNALLYSAMAFTYWQYWLFGMRTDEIKAKAEECVEKALALDPHSPKAHAIRGWMIYDFYRKPQESLPHFKRALALHPDEFEALHGLARAYLFAGKIQAAVPLSERMMRIDPLNPVCWMVRGAIHYFDGRFDLAMERFDKAYQMSPENQAIILYYANTLARLQRVREAIAIIDQAARSSPRNLFIKWLLLLKYSLLNDRESLFREMTADFRDSARKQNGSYYVAVPLALVGAKTDAVEWMENDAGWFCNYPFLAEKDPFLANIRGEPRFKKLMERVKYEWENFEV